MTRRGWEAGEWLARPHGSRRMIALFGGLEAAREAAQGAFMRCAGGSGGALYLSMGNAPMGWLEGGGEAVPAGAKVGAFLDISEVPGLVAQAAPGLAVVDPANRSGMVQGYAHARRLGLALYELDSCLRACGGRALLVCESYQSLADGGGERVRFLA